MIITTRIVILSLLIIAIAAVIVVITPKKIAVVVMANYAGQTDNNSTIIGFKILQELQNGNNLIIKY